MNYQEALKMIGTRPTKKLRPHTYLVRTPSGIAVKLWDTDVITFNADGSIKLDSGGWRTLTTKDRLNYFLPRGMRIQQIGNVWYVLMGNKQYRFADGMVIGRRRGITGARKYSPAGERRDAQLKKRVKTYVENYINNLVAGKIPPPSGGDCWDCVMRAVESGKPLGELKKSDHIIQHIRERYYVPSLLVNAIKAYPVSRMAQEILGDIWGAKEYRDMWDDLSKSQLATSLKRYIYRFVY